FVHGDTPKSMLVYTQSSPEIPAIRDDIEALARATGRGHHIRIAVDTTDAFSWPWVWYLRDYRAVTFADFSAGIPEGPFDVMLVHQNNAGAVNDRLASQGDDRFQSPQRYPHRWWFNEAYKRAMAVEPAAICLASEGNC